LFTNPADVAYADQAAAAIPGTFVQVHESVPLGRMYLVSQSRLGDASHGPELEGIADEVIEVKTSRPSELD
jgi:hypothetical protein